MTKVKICGLRRAEDIAMANEAMPDFIGFVFAPSRRQVTAERAAELKAMLDPRIGAVGVFVNESVERIAEICARGVIDLVQLHGDEDDGYISRLKNAVARPVIKAVRVRDGDDVRWRNGCDFMMYDAYSPDAYGGTGESFRWELLAEAERPFFLAGGLDADNVGRAIELVSPYCVDVSSGVETDGFKDRDKVLRIVDTVRKACGCRD